MFSYFKLFFVTRALCLSPIKNDNFVRTMLVPVIFILVPYCTQSAVQVSALNSRPKTGICY